MAARESTAKVNYTDTQVAQLLARYEELGNDGLETIAAELGKTKRSVISKLVRENAYVAPVAAPKAVKDEGPTKKELLAELRTLVPAFDTDGLNGATKDAISAVIDLAKAAQAD